MFTRFVAVSLLVFLAIFASSAQAAPMTTEFTYQGQLKNAGDPANGLHDLRFKLYDASTLGAQVGPAVCIDNLNVTDGLFTVPLDFGAQFAGQQRFLEIDVRADTGLDCHNFAGFITLTPRQPLTAAPYALYAQSVPMPLTVSGASAAHIIRAENTSTGFIPMAIYGLCSGASGGTTGVRGESAGTNGRGVIGFATAASGTTYGGQFESASTTGTGVWGLASATSGSAYGGRFESDSTAGRGVYGEATATTGGTYGGRFQSASMSGYGVFGWATAATGTNFGVFGRTDSPDGYAGYFTGGKNYFEGSVGIGTNDPTSKLHVVGGADAEPGSGGFVVAGQTNSTNIAIDNNEVMARNNGAASALALNADGGNVNLIQAGTGNVGIGTSSPGAKLDVNGAARADSLEVNGGAIRVIGAGVGTNTAAYIHVVPASDDDSGLTELNHPLLNGNPNAIIFVMANYNETSSFCGARFVNYQSARWVIYTTNGCNLHTGDRYNVLIILP